MIEQYICIQSYVSRGNQYDVLGIILYLVYKIVQGDILSVAKVRNMTSG